MIRIVRHPYAGCKHSVIYRDNTEIGMFSFHVSHPYVHFYNNLLKDNFENHPPTLDELKQIIKLAEELLETEKISSMP